MAVLRGSYGIAWGLLGVASTAFTSSGLIQSYDLEGTGEEKEIMNSAGEIVSWYGYGDKKDCTWTFYVSSNTVNSSASFSPPARGYLMTVTDLNSSDVSGTTWIVKGYTKNAVNNDAIKYSIKATAYPGITS